MSEEELKAILQFKQIDLEDCSCEKCLYQEIESCRGCPTMIKETLLNLIEKQRKEIKILQRDKKNVLEKIRKLKEGLEYDFPKLLGQRQPLWGDTKNEFVSKDKIKEILDKHGYKEATGDGAVALYADIKKVFEE